MKHDDIELKGLNESILVELQKNTSVIVRMMVGCCFLGCDGDTLTMVECNMLDIDIR